MDKLYAMTTFVKIAEKGSLTAAADALDTSLPSVVRILASLEEGLSVRLLNRTTRRIVLTNEGKVYLEQCRKILADIEDAERALTNQQIEPSGLINVTAPVRFGEMHVAPSISQFLQRYSKAQVNLRLLDRVVDLLEEGIDVAIRIAPLADSSFIARPITSIRNIVCASPALLEKVGTPTRPEQLSDLPCIQYSGISSGSTWQFNESGSTVSVDISGGLICNHIGACISACVAGAGFGRFFCYQVMPWIQRGELVPVLTEFEAERLPLALVYPHARLMSARVRVLVDWLYDDLSSRLSLGSKC